MTALQPLPRLPLSSRSPPHRAASFGISTFTTIDARFGVFLPRLSRFFAAGRSTVAISCSARAMACAVGASARTATTLSSLSQRQIRPLQRFASPCDAQDQLRVSLQSVQNTDAFPGLGRTLMAVGYSRTRASNAGAVCACEHPKSAFRRLSRTSASPSMWSSCQCVAKMNSTAAGSTPSWDR